MTPTGGGVRPSLSAEELAHTVPAIAGSYDIVPHVVKQVAGANISYEDIAALAGLIARAGEAGAHGVVITQGTDTIEETAFALDLLSGASLPVVVTGAMRHAGALGWDGPANIASAVRVAASPVAVGLGVVAVLNDEIHAARFVQKMHTHKPSAFASPAAGPLGWVMEDRVSVPLRPAKPAPKLVFGTARPFVPVMTCALGMDARDIASVIDGNPDGVVVAAMGCGHIPEAVVPAIEKLAQKVPVVLASRIGVGELCRHTYGFVGGEIDLLGRGLIASESLSPLKARTLLTILLSDRADRARIAQAFAAF